jgi:hypothetical protein
LARRFTQGSEDEVPQPIQAESSEVVVDCLPRREVAGQKPPGTSAANHVEDGVEDLAQAMDSWPYPEF